MAARAAVRFRPVGAAASRAGGPQPLARRAVGGQLVEQPVIVVFGHPEVVANPVPQAEQQPQLGTVATPFALISARRRPVQRPVHVTLLGEQLSDQVAGTRIAFPFGALPVEFTNQRLTLFAASQRVHRAGQRRPRVGERGTAVRPGQLEALGGDLGLVGQQPLVARPHVRLSPGHASRLFGRRGEMVHAQRRTPMITGAGGVEFDLVEQVIIQDNHVGGRTQVPHIQPFASGSAQAVTRGRRSGADWIVHGYPVPSAT